MTPAEARAACEMHGHMDEAVRRVMAGERLAVCDDCFDAKRGMGLPLDRIRKGRRYVLRRPR